MISRAVRIFTFAVSAAVLLAVGSAPAQQNDPAYDEKITAVRQLLKSNNVDGAIAMLEVMRETWPDDQLIVNLLRNSYDQNRDFARAELFARRLVERDSGNYVWRLYLAESLAKQGQVGAAEGQYHAAFHLTAPSDSGRLYGIFQSMSAYGVFNGALALIDSLRQQSGNTRAFGLQRGMMLQQDRRYADAAKELFSVLSQDTTYAAGDAERQLLGLLEYAEATADVEAVLNSMSGSVNSARALRLLMTHAVKSGQYERAMTLAIRQDSIQDGRGAPLADCVRQCFDRKAYEATIRGADYALSRYAGGPFVSEMRFEQAEALSRLGRHAEALAAYERISATAATPLDKSDSYCGIAVLYLEQLNQPERAIAYFDSVAALPNRGVAYLQAVRLAPLCEIRRGDYAAATVRLGQIMSARYSDDIMEEARYRLALLRLFAGQYDSTKALLKKLMVDHPRGLYVNDAMQLTIDLDQAASNSALLRTFGKAVEYDTRAMVDSSRQFWGLLADSPDQKLADVALFRIALLELGQSDTTAALRALDHLTDNFSESFYRPYGLKLKADLIVKRPTEKEKARLIYRELLEKYPNSPFVSDARKRLRALEEEGKVG